MGRALFIEKLDYRTMIAAGATSSYPYNGTQIYGVPQEVEQQLEPSHQSASSIFHSSGFLYNLSVLKNKVHQVQSLASLFLSSDHQQPPESTSVAMPTMISTLIQEIIVTANSMIYSCQQMGAVPPHPNPLADHLLHHHQAEMMGGSGGCDHGENQGYFSNGTVVDWYGADYNNPNEVCKQETPQKIEGNEGQINNCHIIELDAADILAKYSHYCQVCGKGFKRDANLRMHMRAHGDEYKSRAALSNPMKNSANSSTDHEQTNNMPRKYSCPHQGCRWNKNHKKFHPLKSMICVKNHYKRSHCPKMYMCKRCNRKQFSVVSDLRTHEKHCGDLKWQCSCGTTFSRKDKLMGHVALFIGHSPAINSLSRLGNGADQNAMKQ